MASRIAAAPATGGSHQVQPPAQDGLDRQVVLPQGLRGVHRGSRPAPARTHKARDALTLPEVDDDRGVVAGRRVPLPGLRSSRSTRRRAPAPANAALA